MTRIIGAILFKRNDQCVGKINDRERVSRIGHNGGESEYAVVTVEQQHAFPAGGHRGHTARCFRQKENQSGDGGSRGSDLGCARPCAVRSICIVVEVRDN
jgi:hypothetical protein